LAAWWREALRELRLRHPRWGPKKLRYLLRQRYPRRGLPALRTLERWLQQAGLTQRRGQRAPRGPSFARPKLTGATVPNEVWTLDFKGRFATIEGCRCEPLTVRDLASRFLLAVRIVPALSDETVRPILTGLFRRHGLPGVIRVDNGTPFAGQGPWQLTTLSVWWLRLGIQVEFIRPAKPQDNGGHEQMHRILKADLAWPAAPTRRAQQRRLDLWREEYNQLRPHEGLGLRPPRELYRPSPRPWQRPAPLAYPPDWLTRKVRQKGGIKLRGRLRSIGRAFAGQVVGLKPLEGQNFEVYLDQLLLGILHHTDSGAMRPSNYERKKRRSKSAPNFKRVNEVLAVNCKQPRGGKV
jgi:transposase InsO family protein